ncbi:hypothetical protein SCA03_68640 [Streptomyces cacaoi]|uniref:Uncharacterized protein n=1 Tax=Streptomyces cacaoi TaxID=1898 RepID=A0A4Y3RCC0_STRCI|nr:hypothetical protein SCA03_68640 [Streptomyces cacaoi]
MLGVLSLDVLWGDIQLSLPESPLVSCCRTLAIPIGLDNRAGVVGWVGPSGTATAAPARKRQSTAPSRRHT